MRGQGRAHRPAAGKGSVVDRLADLDEVAGGVAQVAAQLAPAVFDRLREELCAALGPFAIDGLDVADADIQERVDVLEILGLLEGDGRLVRGGAAAVVDDDPAIGQLDDGGTAGDLADDRAAEDL